MLQLSDFEARPYRIPNQEESEDLAVFIEESEEELLTGLLGYELYTEFVSGVSTADLESRWADLRDGSTYQYDRKTYKYRGIVHLLKPAIYALWLEQNAYKLTNVGMVRNDRSDKYTVIDLEPFRVGGWNDYVRRAYDGGCMRNTWYGFMKSREDDYENWRFDASAPYVAYQNRFGF